MIMKKTRTSYQVWSIRGCIQIDVESAETELGRKFNRDELMDYLFGSYSERAECNHELFIYEEPETTMVHRINRLWAYPFTLLVSPYQYIRYGQVGWTHKTKLGKFILTCTGYLKSDK